MFFVFGLLLDLHSEIAPAEGKALRGRNLSAVWSQINGRLGRANRAARLGQVPAGICTKR